MKNWPWIIYLSILMLSCTESENLSSNGKTKAEIPQLKMLCTLDIGIADYHGSDNYDSKIAYSDSMFLVLNYNVGHADFYASTAIIQMVRNGEKQSIKQLDVKDAEESFKSLVNSLGLQEVSIKNFVTNHSGSLTKKDSTSLHLSTNRNVDSTEFFPYNQAERIGNALFHLKYGKSGADLEIIKNKTTTASHITDDLFPSNPGLNFYNIQGDSTKELFLFYPCSDYWDSQCFRISIWDVSDYY